MVQNKLGMEFDRAMSDLLKELPGSLHKGGVDGILLDLGISSMQVQMASPSSSILLLLDTMLADA